MLYLSVRLSVHEHCDVVPACEAVCQSVMLCLSVRLYVPECGDVCLSVRLPVSDCEAVCT